MSVPHTEIPTVAELRRLVKKRERERFSAMWFLEPIQVYFSYALIRMGLNAIQVTVLWLLVAIAGYGVTAVGTPVAIIGGVLLLYLKTILDGADGEVARFQKQFVSPQEDLESFIHGVYLDKVFHIIEKPFWGLSLGFGLYQMTGDVAMLGAGVSLAVFLSFCRHNGVVQSELGFKFQAAVGRLRSAGEFVVAESDDSQPDPIIVRLLDKFVLWIRNGKRFNLLVLCSALTDLMFASQYGVRGASYWLLAVVGGLCPFSMVYMIVGTMRSGRIIQRAVKLAAEK